jgi:hypothetical protein
MSLLTCRIDLIVVLAMAAIDSSVSPFCTAYTGPTSTVSVPTIRPSGFASRGLLFRVHSVSAHAYLDGRHLGAGIHMRACEQEHGN